MPPVTPSLTAPGLPSPTPGGDANTWGAKLDALLEAAKSDLLLVAAAVDAEAAARQASPPVWQ